LELLAGELDDLAAALADDVVMVLLIVLHRLVPCLPVVEVALRGQAALLEQLEGAVHRRVPDARIHAPDGGVELLDGEVALGAEDGALAVEPAPAAVHVVADLAEEHLLPDLDAEAAGELLQLLAEGLVTAAHGASLTDASAFASAALGLRGREGGWYMPRRRAHDQEHPGRAGRVGARQRRSPVRPLAGGALARDGHGAARDRHRLDRGLVLPRRVGLARLRAVPRFLLQDARGAAGARPRAAR